MMNESLKNLEEITSELEKRSGKVEIKKLIDQKWIDETNEGSQRR
jgi:hypothetical protein